jgi:hypothetical protein
VATEQDVGWQTPPVKVRRVGYPFFVVAHGCGPKYDPDDHGNERAPDELHLYRAELAGGRPRESDGTKAGRLLESPESLVIIRTIAGDQARKL